MKSKLTMATLLFLVGTNAWADNNESFSGNLRLGYQYGKDEVGDGNEIAVGGFLHYESKEYNGLSAGATLSTTYGEKQGDGGYFIHGVSTNVALLSEAYLKAKNENSTLTIGRQSLETPFADSDDIGMISNHFGGVVFSNQDIKNTKLTAGFIRSMAVGCGDAQDRFEKLDDGVYMAGIEYDGVENLSLSAWHYDKLDTLSVSFLEGFYTKESGDMSYEVALQYASQKIDNDSNNIYGTMIALQNKSSGLGVMAGYNKTSGVGANNLYGGGPFFTNVEHTTLADGLDNAKAYKMALNLDGERMGMQDVAFSVEKLWIKRENNPNISNLGIVGEYKHSEDIALRAYWSDIKDELDGDKKNLRLFVDYSF